MRFRLVPKSTTLDDLELTLSGHYAIFTLHTCLSEPTTKIRMNRQRGRPGVTGREIGRRTDVVWQMYNNNTE